MPPGLKLSACAAGAPAVTKTYDPSGLKSEQSGPFMYTSMRWIWRLVGTKRSEWSFFAVEGLKDRPR